MSDQPRPTTVVFDPTSVAPLLQTGVDVITEATDLVVDSTTMYQEAGGLLAQVKGSKKRLEDEKEKMLVPLRAMDKAIRAFFDPGIQRRQQVEDALKSKMLAYSKKVEEEAAAARRAAEEQVRKEKERLEREAAAAKAKAEQEAAEARRKAEEAEAARRKAEQEGNARAAAKAAAEAARLQEQAEQKQEAGARQAAELQERAALTSSHTFDMPQLPKASGTSTRRPWKAKVLDKAKLIQLIAANPAAYQHLLDVNESALNKMAGSMQKGLEAVFPGAVEAYQDAQLASKAA